MTLPEEDEEWTELTSATFPRVDLVKAGANGIPFLITKQDESAGLLDPAYVRDLIAKAEPGSSGRERVTMPSGVTLFGSPADIAAFIHQAAQRGRSATPAATETGIAKALAEYEAIVKAKYSAADRKAMAGNGQAMKDGSYPIKDEADLDNAIHAVGHGGADHDAIRRHVITRAKSMGKSSKIPDNWNSDGSLKGDSVSKTANEPVAKDAGDVLDALTDDGVDGMDPTVPLAAPDGDAPGDPTDPGSPAWEAIDAATASKWTSILSRARVAVDILAERELLEAASADPDDAENAWDLQDVCCAIDYAISVLAPFAVAEQSEADCGTDAMAAIGKAMAGLGGVPLERLEGLVAVQKAGRVLSAANESEIRSAAASLQKVLTSLPAAPQADDGGQPVAKQQKETAMADTTAGTGTPAAAAVAKETATPDPAPASPADTGGTTGLGEPRDTEPAAALPGDGPQATLPGDVPGRQVVKSTLPVAIFDYARRLAGVVDPAAIVQRVVKADGDDDGKTPMQAVFDQDGQLIGIVDPAAITPVSGAGKKAGDDGAEPQDAGSDLTPAPASDAGTPASGAPDDDVSKAQGGAEPPAEDVITMSRDVLKSIAQDAATAALEAQGAAHSEVIAKMAADNSGLAEEVKTLKARLETVESHPAAPRVFTNGAVPPAHQMRGQDQGAAPVDVAKAMETRARFRDADPAEQNRLANEMQEGAIATLTAIHARR